MKRQRGFTLIEVMIAVLIAAILGVMAFGAMQEALKSRDRIRLHSKRLQAVQYTMRSLVQDLSQLSPRPIRDPTGSGYLPAVMGGVELTFTRGGWMNPVGNSRSTLQRVRYALRDKKLVREYWLVLDAPTNPLPVSRELLDKVKSFKVRYMNDGRAWQEDWPPPAQNGGARTQIELGWRPIAVEVTIELEDFGILKRIIEVPA